MRIIVLNKIVGSLTLLLFLMSAPTHADAASSDLQAAKKEAEAKGYIFLNAHDEIVALAKKEGKLRSITGLETPNYNPLMNAFRQKYPFISDIHIEEIRRPEAYQRFLLEIKSGAAGWDITQMNLSLFPEYPPFLKKHDVLGMAKHGVLKIDPRMIHPVERNIVSIGSELRVMPYNRKLLSDDKVPARWEDFLKPEFKGKKFVLDVWPQQVAALVPAWGLERTLDFARKLAAQQPTWGSGGRRMLTGISIGEYSLGFDAAFSSVREAMSKDRAGSLSYKVVEPIPARVVDRPNGILNTADHPHAALLWLEFIVSPEGQAIIDKHAPFAASVFTPGSVLEQVARGKKLSELDWDHLTKVQGYVEKIVATYGFPKADK